MFSVNYLSHSDDKQTSETLKALEVQYKHYKIYLTENSLDIDSNENNFNTMKIN